MQEISRSYKISQWCELRGYSRPYFYKLRKLRLAPETIGEGRAQRITSEADARWLKRMTAKAKRRAS